MASQNLLQPPDAIHVSAQFMPAQRPSFLGAALRIGGTIASLYAMRPDVAQGSSPLASANTALDLPTNTLPNYFAYGSITP